MQQRSNAVIVGGGPVGLSLAMELAHRGVLVDIVEPCEDPAERTHPRARYVNLRTAQHFRRWKLADRMREIASFPADWPSDVVFMTQLNGWEIARVRDAFLSAPARSDLYPESSIQLVQSEVETVLREALFKLPNVRFHLGWRCESAVSRGSGVDLSLTSVRGGKSRSLRGTYAVGCDGAGSTIRRSCGFAMEGQARVAENVQIIFEAPDFYRTTSVGPAMMYWSLNKQQPAFISPINRSDRFFLSLHKVSNIEELKQRSHEIVSWALGDGIPFRVLDWDPWVTNVRMATTYRRGRIFLAGDSAHQHPTYGGHGLNLGVSDAVDLGWKLAAVLQGWASDALLDTYEDERRPIGQRILAESSHSFKVAPRELFKSGLEGDTAEAAAARRSLADTIQKVKAPQFRSIGTQIGYCYTRSPIVIFDDCPAPEWNPNDYSPTGAPGSIAPHAWLTDGDALCDRFGPWFTVLVLDKNPSLVSQAEGLAQAFPWRGVPCPLVSIPDESLQSLYGAPIAIIRPDQHVAWRGKQVSGEQFDRIWKTVTANVQSN